jgi:hypothetical protein
MPDVVTTDEYFTVDGVPLNTYAYNIQTSGGNRISPPTFRGGNITIPGRPGARFMKKELDVNQFTLSMWVQGVNPDGSVPTDKSVADKFSSNWRMLRRLLFQVRREMVITKRWHDDVTGAVRSATGKAQYNGGLEPTMTGRGRGLFVVEMLMNDPFFYDDKGYKSLTVSGQTTKTWHETPEGDYRTTAVTATLVGPRVNPKITVRTAGSPDIWVRYAGTVATGQTLTIDVSKFKAILTNADSTTSDVSVNISHGGDAAWLAFEPGIDNTVILDTATGTGAVSINYLSVWF